jgi:hypothetical protein
VSAGPPQRGGGGATGIVSVGAAGLRRDPDHAAELVTQALLGETFVVEARSPAGDWLAVRLERDGYRGWMRAWSATEVGGAEAGTWGREAGAWVAHREAVVRAAPARNAAGLVVAPWQARLPLREVSGRWARVGLPGGAEGFVEHAALAVGLAPGGPPTPARLARTARSMLGVPYLWGGRTPWGFDCSGLVQAVFAWHGQALPRDAAAQFRTLGRPSRGDGRERGPARPRGYPDPRGDLSRLRPGELLFFGSAEDNISHVALGTGRGDFLHAYGQVGAGSLREESQTYVPQLVEIFLGSGEPAVAGPRRPPDGDFPLDRT